MRITIKLFAILKDRAGTSTATLDLSDRSTVASAMEEIANQYPSIRSELKRVAFAVNRNYVKSDATLRDGDELALIPPVSGG